MIEFSKSLVVTGMGIGTLILSFNAPKVLSVQDLRLGLINRLWQIIVAVAIVLMCIHEEPWRKVGTGIHFFMVRPEWPSTETISFLNESSHLLSVKDRSFFVPLNYTYHQESTCEDTTGWCAVANSTETMLTIDASKQIKLSVSARFEPDEDVFDWSAMQVKLFSHDGGFDMSVDEVFTRLAKDQEMSVDEWIAATASKGAEAQLTYDWHCEDSSELAQGDCEVKVELGQISSSRGFQVSSALQPVPTYDWGGLSGAVRRRSHVTGLTVHMRGQGGIEAMAITPILAIIAQVVIFMLLGNRIVTALAIHVFHGSHRRSLRCTEHYYDDVHQQIAEIVRQKKEAQPELNGLSDSTVHAKLVDDIETLCGFELHGKHKKDKVFNVLTALQKTHGNVNVAARVLGEAEEPMPLMAAMVKQGAELHGFRAKDLD